MMYLDKYYSNFKTHKLMHLSVLLKISRWIVEKKSNKPVIDNCI